MAQALFQTKNIISKRPTTETQRPRAITITNVLKTAPTEPQPRTISFSNPLNQAIDLIQSQSSPTPTSR